MHQYFYRKDNDQFGPFNLEELKQQSLQPDTYVWYYGLERWTQVQYIEHLMGALFNEENNADVEEYEPTTPPPLQSNNQYQTYQTAFERPAIPKSWLLEGILITILCCFLPIGIVSIVNGSKVESRYYAGQFEQAEYYSKQAEKWFYIAIIVNIVAIFITFIYRFITL